jgi:hypothetical protein
MARMSKLSETRNRAFDLEFWQAQDSSARFAASWELIENYLKQQGRADELQLQRSVTLFQRQKR